MIMLFKLSLENTLQNASLAFLLLIVSLFVYVLLWDFMSNVNLDWEAKYMGRTKCKLIFQNEQLLCFLAHTHATDVKECLLQSVLP